MSKKVTWTTRDGQVILVSKMELDHMHRCVHLVASTRAVSMLMLHAAIDALRYARDAPDGASLAASEEAHDLIDAAYDPKDLELRVHFAQELSPPVKAMVRRLRRAKVDFLKRPPAYRPKRTKAEAARA